MYTPNSGEGLKRLGFRIHSWDKSFAEYVKELVSSSGVQLGCPDQREWQSGTPNPNPTACGLDWKSTCQHNSA